MYKPITTTFCVGFFLLGLLSTAEAALLSRLGGQAVYDTDLNITWLADANFCDTNPGDPACNAASPGPNGEMEWAQANQWADAQVLGGFDDWRLPTTTQPDPSCSGLFDGFFGVGTGCTGSEMGHLFYQELGGNANESVHNQTGDTPEEIANLALFSNVQTSLAYWSGITSLPNAP